MYKMFFTAYLLIICSQIICSNPVLRECSWNDDCQAGEYCYDKRYCHPCIVCEEHFQQEPRGCAKSPKECGDCLPGFIQDTRNKYYDGRKKCILAADHPIEATTSAKDDYNLPDSLNWTQGVIIALPIVVVILIIALLAILYYFCCKTTTCRYQSPEEANALNEKTNIDAQPSAPLDPLLSNPAFIGHSQIDMAPFPPAYTPQVIPEEAQRARPFSTPSAYVSPPNVSVDNTDSAQANETNMQDDENTQPSAWTPSPSSVGGRTNFAGILQENSNRPVRRDSSPRNIPEEPPSKQAKSDNPVVNINVLTINSSIVQQSSQNNSFPTNVTNINRPDQNTSPSRSRIPDDNQENDEIGPNVRNETVSFVIRSNNDNNIN